MAIDSLPFSVPGSRFRSGHCTLNTEHSTPNTGHRTSRGQASMELLITVGVVLAFSIPVVLLLLSVSSAGYENAAKDQADATARSLADSINVVYAQGPGALREVYVNSPGSTKEIRIEDNEVTVSIQVADGTYDGVSPVFADVDDITIPDSGDPPKSGLFPVMLKNVDGVVEVEYEK